MSKPIEVTLGMQVKFDSNDGPQQGHVVGIHPDYLVVEVAGNLPGCCWKVQRDNATLERAAA